MPKLYPKADYQPLGAQTQSLMQRWDIICLHTMVGSLAGTDAYFEQGGYSGVESHFGVGGSTDGKDDGKVIQWQDLDHRADANLDGNDRVVSIETSDGGKPETRWSDKQAEAIAQLVAWLCDFLNIPCELVPDAGENRRGIAYHRMGCDHGSSYRPKGWPYDKWRDGQERWSTVVGKECPGNVRIKQLVDEVIPRAQEILQGEEDDMFSDNDRAKLDRILKRVNETAKAERDRDAAFREVFEAKLDGLKLPAANKKVVKDALNEAFAEAFKAEQV